MRLLLEGTPKTSLKVAVSGDEIDFDVNLDGKYGSFELPISQWDSFKLYIDSEIERVKLENQ